VCSKLMNFYEELNAEFSIATQRFKAGNYLLFYRDMTHKLSDLLFTKGDNHNVSLFAVICRMLTSVMSGFYVAILQRVTVAVNLHNDF